VFTWEEVNAEKIIRAKVPRSDGRPTGSYEGYIGAVFSNSIEAGDIDLTKPLYWYPKVKEDRWSRPVPNGMRIVQKMEKDATIIELGANRVAKFQRDFPHAMTTRERVQELADAWVKGLTNDDKIWLSMKQDSSNCWILSKLIESDVLDPELRLAIQSCTTSNKTLEENHSQYQSWVADKLNLEKVNPLAAYPLLTSMSMYGTMSAELKNHMTIYVNAVYSAAQNKGGNNAV